MKKSKLPKTDSVQKLAEFWDTHDVTDFESELEEVVEPVFVRGREGMRGRGARGAIHVPLQAREAEAVERMAQAKGVSPQKLVRAWVLQKIARRTTGRRAKR